MGNSLNLWGVFYTLGLENYEVDSLQTGIHSLRSNPASQEGAGWVIVPYKVKAEMQHNVLGGKKASSDTKMITSFWELFPKLILISLLPLDFGILNSNHSWFIVALKHFRADPQPISVQAVGTQDVGLQREILQTEFYKENFPKEKKEISHGQESSKMHLPGSCEWVWWPQQWEMLWSLPPIPHLKVPEEIGSAYREKGKPQSPDFTSCCRGQRAHPLHKNI